MLSGWSLDAFDFFILIFCVSALATQFHAKVSEVSEGIFWTVLLAKLKAETQRAVTDVRRIVYGLRPPALDEFGLVGSLREEVGRLQYEAPALAVTLDAPADGLSDLPAAVEVACDRIVTEALTNVTKHAHASRRRAHIRFDGHSTWTYATMGGPAGRLAVRSRRRVDARARHRTRRRPGDRARRSARNRINARLPAREPS